ncbi:MAG: glycosyltransferase family A protein [Hyphomicrobiales bacterium]|nr:glycosyltransferase family A protein [Hyphomicrobiales bacterium]
MANNTSAAERGAGGPGSISVVIPNRNHAHYVARAIEAYAAQTRLPDEVIVIDDASEDDSWRRIEALAERHHFIRPLRSAEHKGVNRTINQGLKMAGGGFVVAAASDDLTDPAFLEKCSGLMGAHPAAGFCFSDPSSFSAESGRMRHHSFFISEAPKYFGPDDIEALLRKAAFTFPTNSLFFRREALAGIGGFIPALEWHADWFAAHALALRFGACYIPENLAFFQVSASSYSSRAFASWEGHTEVIGRFLDLIACDFADVGERLKRAGVIPEYNVRLIPLLMTHPARSKILSPRLIARILIRHAWQRLMPLMPWRLRRKVRPIVMALRGR